MGSRRQHDKSVIHLTLEGACESLASINLQGYGFYDFNSVARQATERIMAAKEISIKRYVVRLRGEERKQFEALISKARARRSAVLLPV